MAFTSITVTRTYLTPSGFPAQGLVKFIPSSPMVNGPTVVSTSEQAQLNGSGTISISLAANNDPATTPVGAYYRVEELITGQTARVYNVVIPYNAAGATVNLATLAPVSTTAPAVTYVSSVNGQTGAVTVASPTLTDATTSAKGVARILGGTADAPTVPWASITGAPSLQSSDPLLARLAADSVAVTYAASVTLDASLSCGFTIVATGNLTIADISNGTDGQMVYVKVTASGGTRTVTLTGIGSLSLVDGGVFRGWFLYDGSSGWLLSENTAAGLSTSSAVSSVNGKTGAVITLTPDDFTDGTTNHVFTAADDTKLTGIAAGATANSSDATLLARANHTGTQSADTLTNGTTNKVFLATEQTKLTGIATSATANSSDATLLARANHTGTQSADTVIDGTTNHVFTAADDTKLTGVATGATANSSDATLLARANHTGTQAISTVTSLQTALDNKAPVAPAVHAVGNSGSALTLDAASGSGYIKAITLNTNCTFTFTGAAAGNASTLELILTQDATGNRVVTWPASVKWSGGAPTLSTASGAVDRIVLTSYDGGTTWFGDLIGKAYA